MNTLILIAFYLAMFHLIYEMVLLPSFRHVLRFRLFAIRDRLRTLKAEHGHQLDAEVFRYVDESLTWQVLAAVARDAKGLTLTPDEVQARDRLTAIAANLKDNIAHLDDIHAAIDTGKKPDLSSGWALPPQ